MNDDFDELDRSLFALPLATPPAGLRQSILRSTIYAPPVVSPLALHGWEIGAVGVALALAAWLLVLSLIDRTFAFALTADANVVLRSLAEPATLAWLATGGSLAIVLSLTNLVPLRRPLRNGRT